MRTTSGKERPTFARTVDGRTTWELEVEVLTPMFGGGVRLPPAGEQHLKTPDPVTPIRGASVRAQLRFWWRAVNPCACDTVSSLRDAEVALFGAASTPQQARAGALDLRIVRQPGSVKELEVLAPGFKAARYEGRELAGVAYAAFPLRPDKGATNRALGKLHRVDGAFRLAIAFPAACEAQVRAALWGWLNFGGLGGRTRRGFGAVSLVGGINLASLEEGRDLWGSGWGGRDWPTLPADLKQGLRDSTPRAGDPVLALDTLLGRLRTLRQGYGTGRAAPAQGAYLPGRSYWPEADSIRALTGRSSEAHKNATTRFDTTFGLFPRAAFGTPIIFHFKSEDRKDSQRARLHYHGEPEDATLNPMNKGRFASRLLLRPVRVGARIALRALCLDHPEPKGGYSLSFAPANRVEHVVTNPEWGIGDRPSPLVRDGQAFTDPIARFFKELDQ